MLQTKDYRYLFTITGILNLIELFILIAALISVAFTSDAYAELADNVAWIYPDFSTVTVRYLFQSFTFVCLVITVLIIITHLITIRCLPRKFAYLNQTCLLINVLTGLLMISIGICAALWEDKLRRTPLIVKRGYFSNNYQKVFNDYTHPRPGAAAAAATFALIAGILFIIEACTRPMLAMTVHQWSTAKINERPTYTVITSPIQSAPADKQKNNVERLIPIESSTQHRV